MKKLLSAALAAVLTLSLAACSNAPETKEYTTEELSQILSSAISENSDGMAEVITTDSLNAAIDWLTTNKGMSEDEANTFMEEYNALRRMRKDEISCLPHYVCQRLDLNIYGRSLDRKALSVVLHELLVPFYIFRHRIHS